MKNLPANIMVAALLCAAPRQSYASHSDQSYRLPDPVTAEHNSIHYTVLPQVELISIVQAISEYPHTFGFLMQPDSFRYKEEVLEYFKPFRDHPVVKWLNETSVQPRKMNFSAPPNLMLYTDDHLNLRTDLQLDDFVLSRAGGRDSLARFLALLKDFAIKSSFNRFYENHASYYRQIIAGTIAQVDSIDHIKELENFYGMKQKSYNIVLVSLYNHVGYGNWVVYTNGDRSTFDTMGPQKIKDGIPFFGDRDYLKYLTRHEFSHPFVNPLTDKYWELIKVYSAHYDSIPETAKKNVCGDWKECIDEFVVRAVTVRIAFLESKEVGTAVYNREKSRGVSYLDPLLASLEKYAKDRERYPNFDSYFPELLEVFKK